jgi:hypothetical protein
VRENSRNLEGPDDTPACGLRWFLLRDVVAIEDNAAGRWRQEFGEQVEKRGFARAVGADQRMDVATLDLQVHVVDRDKAFELFGQTACFKNGIDWQMILQQVKDWILGKAYRVLIHKKMICGRVEEV